MKSLCLVNAVEFPNPSGISTNMMPFVMGDSASIPGALHGYLPLIDACLLEREQMGRVGYLSVTESRVTAQRPSQRRPGIHTEKHPSVRWGGGGGWGGPEYPTDSRKDGLYMASTVGGSCRAWDVHIETPGPMGDCEHLRKELDILPAVLLEGDKVYWLTDSCPHESLPLEPGTFRQWFRLVTHKIGLWYAQHSTPSPLGVQPDCRIVHGDKFKG